MPRAARLVLPDVALHLVQRGVDRRPCFFARQDYSHYLQLLAGFAPEFGCSIHAYCLMTNHVHLLLTPHAQGACARLMKQLNQCYVQDINRARGRTGPLWAGRFHSCVITTLEYALNCYRYIELNPVRAGLASCAGEYRWSSYRANAGLSSDPMLSAHDAYAALHAADPFHSEYRRLFDEQLDPAAIEEIRTATRGGRRIGEQPRPRGRPRFDSAEK
jgi:putative transposase